MATPRILGSILALLALTSASARAEFLHLPDINAYIEVSGQTVIGTASTYEAIFLFKSATGSGVIANETTAWNEDKLFQVAPASGVYGYSYDVNYPNVLAGPVAGITLDAWHHAAYVYDGAEERLYFDGTLVGSRAASGNVGDGSGLMYIGASVGHGNTTFVGLLDSVRVSNVARYAGASFTPPTGDLASDANTLLLYNFDDAAGSSTVVDSSPSGRNGTFGSLNGGPLPVSCGADTSDTDLDLIPDACDPDVTPTTTTTIATPTTTTTVTTTTTSSTLVTAVELCGNCLDDDGDGQTDFEDTDCCPGQTATLTLKKGVIKPGAGGVARLALAATLSAAGLESGATATQDAFVQLASAGGEVLCAQVPAASLTRKKRGVSFADRGHAVAPAQGLDRLIVTQKKSGAGRLKVAGRQVSLTLPAAGRIGVVLAWRNPATAESTNVCATGGGTFHATRKGVLKFP